MKRIVLFFVCAALCMCATPARAEEPGKVYRVEVLQVAKIDAYQAAYEGFMDQMKKEGFIEGKNLKVNRVIIDYDLEKAGVFDKVSLGLFRLPSEASRIASSKADLALTIGTPATKHARGKITGAGIPLVFTAVAIPQAAGCPSLTQGGPGVTGSTLYMNMANALKIVRACFPNLKTIGIVHTDDENGIAHVEEAKKHGPALGFKVISKEVSKKDPIEPALKELLGKGAEAFAVPLDTYYGIRDFKYVHDLRSFTVANNIPVISFAFFRTKGAVLSVGTDFYTVGGLAAKNAAKILKEGRKPESLPILHQDDLTIMVDSERLKALGLSFPIEVLKLATEAK